MKWWELAQKVYQQRGYLVIARHAELRIGEVVHGVTLAGSRRPVDLPQPFSVVAETTLEDYAAQHKTARKQLDKPTSAYRFYRIVTD